MFEGSDDVLTQRWIVGTASFRAKFMKVSKLSKLTSASLAIWKAFIEVFLTIFANVTQILVTPNKSVVSTCMGKHLGKHFTPQLP